MTPVNAQIDSVAVLDIVAQEGLVPRDGLTLDSRLDGLGIPSLEMLNILFAVEDQFGVIVEPSDLAEAVTIGDLLQVISARMHPPEAAG